MTTININVGDLADFILVEEDLKLRSNLTYRKVESNGVYYTRMGQKGDVVYIVNFLVSDKVMIEEMDEIFRDESVEPGDVSKPQLVYINNILIK
jgi:hypothetical protein